MIAHVLCAAGAAGEARDPGSYGALIIELMQHAPALAERGAHRAARDDQERHRIRIRLRDGGQCIGHTGTGNHECRGRASAHPRVAVGGEAGVLLVAHQHVAQAREFQAAVQLDVVHARNAKHRVDAVGRQCLDDVASDRPGSRAHALEMLTPRTHSTNVKFSALVKRISGDGADAWLTHYQAVAARERGEDVIVLSVGDPDLDTPAPVIERAGAQNPLFVASMCLAGRGDEVVPFEPLYPTYPATIEVSGARLVRVPAAAGWRPDLAALASLITTRSRAIFWATPNNPSGVVLNDAELTVIAELARRHDLWLVSDEVYAGLAPGGRVPSLAARFPERVVTVGSLSKSHSMTGWRAGWLVGPRELAVHA